MFSEPRCHAFTSYFLGRQACTSSRIPPASCITVIGSVKPTNSSLQLTIKRTASASSIMAYEAAAAVSMRDQSQLRGQGKGSVRRRRQQPVTEEKVVMRCGVLRILRRFLPLSKEPPLSEKK
ncbi:unnamed protein product [Urochloa humidicola]